MLASELVAEIQARVTADYECPDAPGFRDSLAARRDVAALLKDRAEMQAEIERLRAALKAGQVGHIIEFRDNGWTIQHPLSCRPNLFECEVNRAAERDVDGVPPEGVGRYVCGAEEGGRFWYDGASNAALEARDE